MVQNQFRDDEAREYLATHGEAAGEDLALRLYTSHLLGRDRSLVLHGGGNTSVKRTVADRFGQPLEVLSVKGSGRDLEHLDPDGLPSLELAPLRELLQLPSIGDHELVSELRRAMLDSRAPNPSVETLLHAAIPHKFVDHTHADAVLVLSNQPDGAQVLRAALGDRVVVLDYVQPGFPLAQAVAEALVAAPDVEGIVLMYHGLFTFGEDARTSYDRMIGLVQAAEKFAEDEIARRVAAQADSTPQMHLGPDVDRDELLADAARLIPNVRGAVAIPSESPGFGGCCVRGAAPTTW